MATPIEAPAVAKIERFALRPEEAAASIGISRAKFYQLMKSGEVPFVMLGGNRRIRPAALTDYLDRVEAERGTGA